MTNGVRADPPGNMNDLVRGFMLQPVQFEEQVPQIKVDVEETDKAYVVHAEIPGVKKEDIAVDLSGNMVYISVEMRQDRQKKKAERVISSECYRGARSRSFSLAHDVDEGAARAVYTDGVLELTLPKKAGARQKRVDVR